ncbi:MAG: dephospho-CoA kinase [Planctomycetes bacterium]|nr:dephospho-CoA kinase [Planctomycetota bacterium]
MCALPKVIPVLGVIGGIGSGKSSVARRLQSLRPIAVIDADQFGHQVLNLPNVQERILKRFGPTVFENPSVTQPSESGQLGIQPIIPTGPLPDGRGTDTKANPQISRAALGRVIFGSDVAAETARRDLEAIVHPEIRSLLEHTIRELQQQANVEAIVLDAAVLLEAGWNDLCDVVVFIDTPQADRIARVQAGRGWSAEQLAEREASQWPLPRKRAAADAVIDNSNSVDDAARQLEQVIQNFVVRC